MTTSTPTADTPPLSIAEFAAELLGDYATQGYRACTIGQVRHALYQLVELAEVRTAADLNDDAIRRFIDRQSGDQSSHTFYSKLSALRALFNHAVRLGLLAAPPSFPFIPQVKERGVGRPSEPVPTREEVASLLAHLRDRSKSWEGHRLYALVSTILFAGLLKHEALFLRVEDCDLDGRTIRIPRREQMQRTLFPSVVRISATLSPILDRWLALADSEWVFPNKTRPSPWTGGVPGKKPLDRLQAAARELGIAGMTFEALRRFYLAHASPSIDLGTEARPFATVPRAPRDDRGRPDEPGPSRQRHAVPVEAPPVRTSPPPRRTKPRAVTLRDATRLMAHLLKGSASWEGHRLYAVVGLALYTGLRRGRVLKLRVEDCDLSQGILRIPGRSIPLVLSPAVARILADWIPRNGGSPWVFPGTKLLGPWLGGRLGDKPYDQLRRASREAGISDATFEALRALWNRHAGRVALGDDYRSLHPPERTTEGPRPRRPGPAPSRPRAGAMPALGGDDMRVDEGSRDPVPPWTAPIVLGGDRNVPPVVMGRRKKRLSRAGYLVVKAMLEAGPDGLIKPRLELISGDARGILLRLRNSDPDWMAVIRFPGDDGQRHYRIVSPERG